jgi:hypothetical protein
MREVGSLLPPRSSRGPICGETARQWCVKGIRGVKLESVQLGRNRYTTEAAVARFIAAINKPIEEAPQGSTCEASRVREGSRPTSLTA